ncbi:MAG: DJ-1/PfpI family protein [Chloroflexota bacterium]|nr:DJ-1/PfpI family protein [Chloroflexota bacterium]
MSRNVAILIFEDVELLDFAGPFEIFTSVSSVVTGEIAPFNVFTVALEAKPLHTRYGLIVTPHYAISTCEPPDILVIPGGRGARKAMRDPQTLNWIKSVNAHTELTTSVCTGALVLGAAGLLDGLQSTTHYGSYDALAEIAPLTTVLQGVRFVDNGRIITSAGVQAGMDMSLHIVARLHGNEVAHQTARHIEYRWTP